MPEQLLAVELKQKKIISFSLSDGDFSPKPERDYIEIIVLMI